MNAKLRRLTIVLTALLAQNAMAQDLVGITQDNRLFTMASIAAPGVVSTPIAITGMTAGQTIVGADYRPLNGELYALGYDGTNNTAQLYTVNTTTGVATAVSSTPMALLLGNNLSIGFDFNPTVDRIRVVGANGKNYRLNPITGTIAATDTDLSFATGDLNFGAPPGIGAVAYTNSYVGSSTTTLYNYDQTLNVLTTQNPPNNGTLNTIGGSGLVINMITHSIDMDIYMDPVTLTNMAYLAANTGAAINDNLYTINLATGAATNLGLIGGGLDVKNIAIPLRRTLPAVTGHMVYGIQAGTANMLSFDTDNPRLLRSYMAVTGMLAGQTLVGIDFRPSNMQLYALGYDNLTTTYQLYTINTTTAVATPVNTTPITLDLGLTTNVAFDFNPVADRIRVISRSTGVNYRLNPNDGSIAATDTTVAYIAGDVSLGKKPRIGAVAYTNSYNNSIATELYGIDDSTGSFVKINSPNGGTLSTTNLTMYSANLADISTDIDFFYDSVTATSIGYMSANTLTATSDKLYTVNMLGVANPVSDIGLGIAISDIAVRPEYSNKGLGVANIKAMRKTFTVYPDPATDVIYIRSASNDANAKVTITDVSGRIVKTAALADGRIDISALQQGVYFVRLQADGEIYLAQKIIKQ